MITIKTNILLHKIYVILADFGYSVKALWFTGSQNFLNCLAFQLDEGYSRITSCTLYLISIYVFILIDSTDISGINSIGLV